MKVNFYQPIVDFYCVYNYMSLMLKPEEFYRIEHNYLIARKQFLARSGNALKALEEIVITASGPSSKKKLARSLPFNPEKLNGFSFDLFYLSRTLKELLNLNDKSPAPHFTIIPRNLLGPMYLVLCPKSYDLLGSRIKIIDEFGVEEFLQILHQSLPALKANETARVFKTVELLEKPLGRILESLKATGLESSAAEYIIASRVFSEGKQTMPPHFKRLDHSEIATAAAAR